MPEKKHPGSFPLSGLLKCPKCGSPMVQGNSNPKYKYYICNKRKDSGKSACSADLIGKEITEMYVYQTFFQTLKTIELSSPYNYNFQLL